jgi:PAS domain S-box-containing protein
VGSDIIFVVDYDANFLYHNKSVKDTLGYSNKSLVGRNFFEFIHPLEVEEFEKKFNTAKKKPYYQGVEFQFLCQDGTYRFLEFNSINLKQKDGLNGLIMDCRDITQRKKDAIELLRAQKARELFLANISHEIRTPINGISGMATLLSNNPSAEDAATYLNAIKSASDNLKVIISDILDLSSIESGKLKFELIGFNMEDLVVSLMNSFKAQALTRNLDLTYSIEEEARGIFMGDPVRLNQILINLIGNALKFTHRGSIKLNVSVVKPGKTKSTLQFDVIDTGIGVPQEKMATIFESFSQADASVTRKYGGTGLGLTIVKQLVELQKGWIKLKSEESVGSTFTVAIPYLHGEPDVVSKKASRAKDKTIDGIDLSNFTILLVEDNDINRLYAGSILKSCGCKIETAENGLVALGKLKGGKVDLVLMDIQMPVMDGFEATKAIRSGDDETRNLPVIALTANATPKVIEKCLDSGMNDHLAKPFTPDELFTMLEKYLSNNPKPNPRKKTAKILHKRYATVDLSFLAKVSGNDSVFVKEVISSFRASTPPLLETIREDLIRGNARAMAQNIHKIKPSLTMLGLTKTKELGDYLEAELNSHELTDYLRQGIDKFCEEVHAAIVELSA